MAARVDVVETHAGEPRSVATRDKLLAAAVVAVLAGGAVAAGTVTAPPPSLASLSPGKALAGSAAALKRQPRVSFVTTTRVTAGDIGVFEGGDVGPHLTTTVTLDSAHDAADVVSVNGTQREERRRVGGTVYAKPAVATTPPWQAQPVATVGFTEPDPAATLAALAGLTGRTEQPMAVVDGVQTRHFQGSAALTTTPGDLTADLQDELPSGTLHGQGAAEDVWIGADGLVRRISLTAPVSISGISLSAEVTTDFVSFGATPAVAAPPADQVRQR